MKQKEIEFVAYQLSKITDNIRYHFPPEYYNKQSDHDFGNKDINVFFEDAKNYLKATSEGSSYDVYFTLRFKDLESYNTAFKLLEYFDFIIDDGDEKNFTVDEEQGLYEFYVVVTRSNVHSFIFEHSNSFLSLVQLSKIVKTPILFKYEYEGGNLVIKPENDFFIVENGYTKLSGSMEITEIKTLNDIHSFNNQLLDFISLFPSYKYAFESNISILINNN